MTNNENNTANQARKIEIVTVRTHRQKKQFVDLQYKLYRDNPYWAPPFRMDELNMMDAKKNPAMENCDAEWFLAIRDGEVVGRVGGIIHRGVNEKWNRKSVRFTRIDFIDDEEVSRALTGAVEEWGKSRGMTEAQGPLGFSDLDFEGMLVEGFDEMSTFVTIYNYPYYPKHLEKLGYKKDTDWVEYQITVPEQPDKRVEKIAKMISERYGFKLVEVDSRTELVKNWAQPLFEVLIEAYSPLYGTAPLTKREINSIISQFITFLNPDFVKLVVDKDNKLAAFGICYPSLTEAARKSKGNLLPFGIFRFLRAMKHNDKLEMLLVGVLPEHQGKGLNAILMDAITKTAMRYGIRMAESNPELEDNQKVQALWKFYETRQHRRRRAYVKPL